MTSFVYGDHDQVTVYEINVGRLDPLNPKMLTDDVLGVLIKRCYDQLPEMKKELTHLFNSQFYSKLCEGGGPFVIDAKEAHQRVAKWTKHIDIFSKDFILVPINLNFHWSLGVIVRPRQLLIGAAAEDNLPCILHMDSLGSFHNPFDIAKNLRNYLKMEGTFSHRLAYTLFHVLSLTLLHTFYLFVLFLTPYLFSHALLLH